jgi:hypothetical protein
MHRLDPVAAALKFIRRIFEHVVVRIISIMASLKSSFSLSRNKIFAAAAARSDGGRARQAWPKSRLFQKL